MLTPPTFDPLGKPSALSDLIFECRKPYLLWRWRNYAREDREVIGRLVKAGVAIETLWDVGASNGAWSWIVGRGNPGLRHHMFEPLAMHVEGYATVLQHHLKSFPNWTLHPMGLGAVDQEATIYADQASYGSSFIAGDYGRQNWRSIHVQVRSGDSLIASGEAPVPDLVKADTQGYELELLKGLKTNLPRIKVLLLETWLMRGYGAQTPLLTELIDWLRPRDFIPFEFADSYRDPVGHMRSVDAYFIRRDVAATIGYTV